MTMRYIPMLVAFNEDAQEGVGDMRNLFPHPNELRYANTSNNTRRRTTRPTDIRP